MIHGSTRRCVLVQINYYPAPGHIQGIHAMEIRCIFSVRVGCEVTCRIDSDHVAKLE
jgi:hypothetical protein